MAKLFLESTDTSYKVSSSNTTVYGASGSQAVTVDAGVTGVTLDGNVERVQFGGATSDYKYKQVGANLEVYSADGTTLVAKVPVQDDANGSQLTFANGTVDAKIGASGLTVGGTTVTTTAAAVAPTTIDTTVSSVPLPSFSVTGAANATEGGNALFTVTLANPSATASTTVRYTFTNVGGASDNDTADETISGTNVTGTISTAGTTAGTYVGSLTFAPGATSAQISLPVLFDTIVESGEGISLTLSNPSSGVVSASGAAVTTTFVDAPAPTFTMTSSASGLPTQEGQTITFTVTPASVVNADTQLSVNVVGQALGGVDAKTSPTDFTAASSLTFHAGDTAAKTVTVTVVNDGTTEGLEAYKAQLLDSSFNEKAAVTGTVTDPIPTITLSSSATAVNEGAAVTLTATSDIAAPTGGLSIPYTLGGTATNVTDYTGSAATTGTITIAAGATTGTLTLNAVADNATEGAETVTATLSATAGASVNTAPVSVTINDTSLALPANQVSLSGPASVNEGASATYTVTVGAAVTGTAVTVPYTLTGTATAGTDFTGAATGTFTIPVGSTSATVTLPVTADSATEGSETVIMTLGTPSTGFTVGTGLGAVTTTVADTSVTVTGSSFTLTTAIDTPTATAGNDTFIGDFTATSTINAGDQIDGLGGLDTFKMYGTYDSAKMPISLANVEVIQLMNSAADTSISTAALPSVNKLQIDQVTGTGTSAYTTGAGTTLQLSSLAGLVSTGVTTWTASASDTSQNLILNGFQGVLGGTAAALTTTGAATTTVNITSQGTTPTGSDAANQISTLTVPATTTKVVVTGAAGLQISTSLTGANIATVDASNSTGGVDINVAAATAAALTFLGGTGNDIVRFAASAFSSADTVNLGTGTNTLFLADTAIGGSATASLNTAINAVTTATRIGISGAATVDMSGVTATTLSLGSGNNVTLQKLESTDRVLVEGVTAGTVDATASLGYNTLNLDLVQTGEAVAATGALTTTSQANVNISSTTTGTAVTANTIGGITNSANTVFNITGSQALTLGTLSAAASVNAANFTGVLTVTGANAASSFTGGSKADVLTGATLAGGDTFVGNAGNDTINTGAQTGTTATTITGGTGADTINIQAATAVVGKLYTINATAAQSYATAGQFDTVRFTDMATNGTDIVTLVTGVSSSTVTGATSVTLGTTTVTPGSFLAVGSSSATLTTTDQNFSIYQDSNSNGVIDATDLRVDFTDTTTVPAAVLDTMAITIVGGQLVVTSTGV